MFLKLLLLLFYKVERAEYFRFDRNREFLVIYYHAKKNWPFLVKERTSCERDVANNNEQTLRPKAMQISDRVRVKNCSLQEFTEIARTHPVLKNDDWVQARLETVDSGIARR